MLQEVGRDHTEPEFTVFLEAEDDRSNVILTLDVGTVPGGTNVLAGKELGGFSTTLNDVSGLDLQLLSIYDETFSMKRKYEYSFGIFHTLEFANFW